MLHLRSEAGQSTVENMLVVSVLTVAIVGASYAFVPVFSGGVEALGRDIARVLDAGSIGDGGGATNGIGDGRHGLAAGAAAPSMALSDGTTNDTTSIPNMNNQDTDRHTSDLDGMVADFESAGGGDGGGSGDGNQTLPTGNDRLGRPFPG